MKRIIFIAVALLIALAHPAMAGQDKDYDAKVKAAKVYLKASSAETIIDQALEGLSRDPRVKLSAADIASIKSSIDVSGLNKLMLDSLIKTFSLDELKMLAQFFGSPTGQSIMKKMPSYMAEFMPTVQKQIHDHVVAYLKKKQSQQQDTSAPATAPASAPATAPAPASVPTPTPTQH